MLWARRAVKGTQTTVGDERDWYTGWRTGKGLGSNRSRALDQGTSFRKEKKACCCAHLTDVFSREKGQFERKGEGQVKGVWGSGWLHAPPNGCDR